MNLGAILSDRVLNGDFLAARDGKIAALGVGAPPEAANTVDAAGSLIFVVLIGPVFAPIWVRLGFGEVPGTLAFIGAAAIPISVGSNALLRYFTARQRAPIEP